MYAFIIFSTAVTISSTITEFIAFAVALVGVTAVMLRLYLPAATQVKHLRAKSAGKVVGLSAEVLEGLKVVQAYRHQEHFVRVRTGNSLTTKEYDHRRTLSGCASAVRDRVSFRCGRVSVEEPRVRFPTLLFFGHPVDS